MHLRFPLFLALAVALLGGAISQSSARATPGVPDKVFVLIGDEQVVGRAPLTTETPNADLWVWQDGEWKPGAVDPLGYSPSSDDGVGPGRAFGLRALADLGGQSVGLIVCGAKNSSIASWKGRKSVYKKCEQQARPSKGRIVGFVVVEGTWDSTKSSIQGSWPKAFHNLLNNLRNDLGLDVPAVVAEVGAIQGTKFKYVDQVRAAQDTASAEQQTAVVPTGDLDLAANQVDFTAGSYETLGERLEAAWWQLVDGSSIASEAPPDQVFILAGQSNMVGRGEPLSQGTPSNPSLWNWRGGFWRVASDPLGSPSDPQNGIGPGMTFGTGLLAAEPGARIGLVMCAIGATGMHDWQPGQGPYENCVREAAATGGTVTGLLLLQGERDATTKGLAQKWAAGFARMLSGFRSVFGDIPAVIAKIGNITAPGYKYVHLVQEQQDLAATQNPDVGIFATDDEPMDPGSPHYTVPGYKDVGSRFASAWLALTGP